VTNVLNLIRKALETTNSGGVKIKANKARNLKYIEAKKAFR